MERENMDAIRKIRIRTRKMMSSVERKKIGVFKVIIELIERNFGFLLNATPHFRILLNATSTFNVITICDF